MFTGIVEELGTVEALDLLEGDAARLRIHAPLVTSDAGHGDSISVNGCCLTVIDTADGTFTADVMRETLQRTSLGSAEKGARVNLERAVAAHARLGGHIVQGHVDGVGTIASREPAEHWEVVRIAAPAEILRYVAEKGSIAVDGVSLTVTDVDDSTGTFGISLIPTTLELTVLGRNKVGDTVNLEVDVIAKYVERLLTAGAQPNTVAGGKE
ncbi:riboflavin synthase [Kribbella sp. VKM Ac-2568]|uniref:riboflavin synthase n=1 Tax=Kribbella sp. VKM Ac-2568 TaxID=2512219 RepID=UPI0010449328|nr:riboflavin synthase [Kribbella sp. VKM Ac-2568]TCM41681.1 riboflavin synthase alpha chain [Kribbella sp. VKM Ac-2568]